MPKKKRLLFIFITAVVLKVLLFTLIAYHSPNSKLEADSHAYLQTAETLMQHGVFARYWRADGTFLHEFFRTPGYPVFLGISHNLLKIPLNGIIVLQILVTALAAFMTYKTARLIDERLGLLSAVIILFDPPITIFSFMILTESLFLLLISLFMYTFIRYLKDHRLDMLFLSAIFIVMATYVRPVSYFLAIACAGFIFLTKIKINWKKTIAAIGILLITVYSLLGIWQYRNYKHFRSHAFSDIGNATVESPEATGLWKSFKRNQDEISRGLPAPLYYANVSARCFLSLFTRPGTFKYFDIKPLKTIGKILSYPWMVFWLAGFFIGLFKLQKNRELQSLAFVVLYFTSITIVATMWGSNERFRVAMMPFIAIIAAWGWQFILQNLPRKISTSFK